MFIHVIICIVIVIIATSILAITIAVTLIPVRSTVVTINLLLTTEYDQAPVQLPSDSKKFQNLNPKP